jgi:hypothetical protein
MLDQHVFLLCASVLCTQVVCCFDWMYRAGSYMGLCQTNVVLPFRKNE